MKKSPLPLLHSKTDDDKKKKLTEREKLVKLLRWHFGHANFRGKQLDAIEAVLSGRDCFCLMPTGGGKSMCYQIPALAKPGIVLVVSPLIALMENQVMALKEKGITAEFLSSTQTSLVKNKIYDDIDSGKPSIRLLYVTPELIATQGFMSKLTKIHSRGLLNLIAIDEAHCVSTWGHDFRPAYRKLSSLKNHLSDVPVLALTATAAPKVQKDVIESLCLRDPMVFKSSFNRPNIYYEVRYKDLLDDAYADLSSMLKSSGNVCTIIYCLERATCDGLSAHLSQNGISCAAYHAGLNSKLRSSILDNWISSKIQVIVATVAFGMGIDRKDVRIVCHYNVPKSMEAFYQESGRAGRDQQPSRSLLYYGVDDCKKMQFILSNSGGKKSESTGSQEKLREKSLSNFKQMIEYCEGSGCRRRKILESFGERVPESLCKKSCDACKHPNEVAKYLQELRTAYSERQRNNFSQVFISSSTEKVDREQVSEFWNHDDDEASDSKEDISDSDDGIEDVKSLTGSKFSRRAGLNEKIELLQRAEEKYYQTGTTDKKDKKVDKNAISETLRETSKQRLFKALKQAAERLDNSVIEFETSSSFLENECYKKYGKSGKSFYYSQVASTVRRLSTINSSELTTWLSSMTPCSPDDSPTTVPESPEATTQSGEPTVTEHQRSMVSETSISASPRQTGSQITKLLEIPSFSQFVHSKKQDGQVKILENRSREESKNTQDKRMRLK